MKTDLKLEKCIKMELLHWWKSEGKVSHNGCSFLVKFEHEATEIRHFHLPGILVFQNIPGTHKLDILSDTWTDFKYFLTLFTSRLGLAAVIGHSMLASLL